MERWGKPSPSAVVAERGMALDDQTLARLRAPTATVTSASPLMTVKLHVGKSPKNTVFQISPNVVKRKRSHSSSNGEQRVSLCGMS